MVPFAFRQVLNSFIGLENRRSSVLFPDITQVKVPAEPD